MERRWPRYALGMVLLFLFAFDIPSEKSFEISRNIEVFSSVYAQVNKNYVEDVNPNKLIKVGLDAMLAYLDPYTNYISQDRIEDYMVSTTGQYGGIGSVIGVRRDSVVVLMPHIGYPAHEAGLKRGDIFLKVDGKDVIGMNTQEISSLLKGEFDTDVNVLVKRYGIKEPMSFNLKRSKIQLKNVPYYGMLKDDIGYIKLANFMSKASDEVKAAYVELKEKGAKKVVLDLRDNPGGYLAEAQKICNIFIPKGKVVVNMKGKIKEWNRTVATSQAPYDLEVPIAVLTSGYSASASEIVSGVIQDYDRGIVVGQRTYGKGLVQNTFDAAHKTKVKITTAKYYIPSGRCIQAIDYSKKNPDGTPYRTPDSLFVAFKTEKGRVVYDGGGVLPDVIVEKSKRSDAAYQLLKDDMFFDFAVDFCSKRDSIPSPDDFKLNDMEFKSFLSYLEKSGYEYISPAEQKLNKYYESFQKDSLDITLNVEINAIRKKIKDKFKNDFNANKSEIIELLEDEIVKYFYYEEGSVRASFDTDKELNQAIELLNDEKRYDKLLSVKE